MRLKLDGPVLFILYGCRCVVGTCADVSTTVSTSHSPWPCYEHLRDPISSIASEHIHHVDSIHSFNTLSHHLSCSCACSCDWMQ